jgi:hypothetical protein
MAFTFSSGTATASTTAAALVTIQPGQWTILTNTGSNTVFLGGSTVTSSGASIGWSLAANATVTLPAIGGEAQTLYGITSTSTSALVWLVPAL